MIEEDCVDRAKLSLIRRIDRLLVYVGMGVVVYFLERIVLRSGRTSRSD